MARSSPAEQLMQQLSGFEAVMLDAAQAIVREVFAAELTRRRAALTAPTPPPTPRPRAKPVTAPPPTPIAAAPAPVAVGVAAPVAAPAPAGKRRGWTRETVIDELATWLLSGTEVEASFVRRYGQPGLAAAAKRIFGRFDAALNAANLALAQRYPDGPPTKKPMA